MIGLGDLDAALAVMAAEASQDRLPEKMRPPGCKPVYDLCVYSGEGLPQLSVGLFGSFEAAYGFASANFREFAGDGDPLVRLSIYERPLGRAGAHALHFFGVWEV